VSLAVCFYLVMDLANLNAMAWSRSLWVILRTPQRDNLPNISRDDFVEQFSKRMEFI